MIRLTFVLLALAPLLAACGGGGTTTPPPDPPRVLRLTPVNFRGGFTGGVFSLSVDVAGSPTAWNWQFGGGASSTMATTSNPTITLGTPGDYTGSIVASKAGSDSDPLTFDYLVRPGFQSYEPAGADSFAGQALVYHGRPVVLVSMSGNLGMMIAQTAAPASAADWSPAHVVAGGPLIGFERLGVVADRLAVAYRSDSTGGVSPLNFAHATVEFPGATVHWQAQVFHSAEVGEPWGLADINGRPAVLYGETKQFETRRSAYVAAANNPAPAQQSEWTVRRMGAGQQTAGAMVGYHGRLVVAVSTTMHGTEVFQSDSAGTAWDLGNGVSHEVLEPVSDLIVANDALTLLVNNQASDQLVVLAAAIEHPTVLNDWERLWTSIEPSGRGVLASVDGRLVVSYHAEFDDETRLYLARQIAKFTWEELPEDPSPDFLEVPIPMGQQIAVLSPTTSASSPFSVNLQTAIW